MVKSRARESGRNQIPLLQTKLHFSSAEKDDNFGCHIPNRRFEKTNFQIVSSPGCLTTSDETPLKTFFYKSLRYSSWAWNIEHAKPNVSRCTVTHLYDMWAILANGIAPEKRLHIRNNLEKINRCACIHSCLIYLPGQSVVSCYISRTMHFFVAQTKNEPMYCFLSFGKLTSLCTASCRSAGHTHFGATSSFQQSKKRDC